MLAMTKKRSMRSSKSSPGPASRTPPWSGSQRVRVTATVPDRPRGRDRGLPQPRSQDLLVQEMRLTVEPKSLAFLDDKVLDAELGGDEIEFRIYPQPAG